MIDEKWTGAHKRDVPERYLMATAALHKLADVSRDEPALALIHGETAHFWVGEWVTGFGLIDVHFPKATTHPLTDEERETYGKKLVECGGIARPIRLDPAPEEREGTDEELHEMVVDAVAVGNVARRYARLYSAEANTVLAAVEATLSIVRGSGEIPTGGARRDG